MYSRASLHNCRHIVTFLMRCSDKAITCSIKGWVFILDQDVDFFGMEPAPAKKKAKRSKLNLVMSTTVFQQVDPDCPLIDKEAMFAYLFDEGDQMTKEQWNSDWESALKYWEVRGDDVRLTPYHLLYNVETTEYFRPVLALFKRMKQQEAEENEQRIWTAVVANGYGRKDVSPCFLALCYQLNVDTFDNPAYAMWCACHKRKRIEEIAKGDDDEDDDLSDIVRNIMPLGTDRGVCETVARETLPKMHKYYTNAMQEVESVVKQ